MVEFSDNPYAPPTWQERQNSHRVVSGKALKNAIGLLHFGLAKQITKTPLSKTGGIIFPQKESVGWSKIFKRTDIVATGTIYEHERLLEALGGNITEGKCVWEKVDIDNDLLKPTSLSEEQMSDLRKLAQDLQPHIQTLQDIADKVKDPVSERFPNSFKNDPVGLVSTADTLESTLKWLNHPTGNGIKDLANLVVNDILIKGLITTPKALDAAHISNDIIGKLRTAAMEINKMYEEHTSLLENAAHAAFYQQAEQALSHGKRSPGQSV